MHYTISICSLMVRGKKVIKSVFKSGKKPLLKSSYLLRSNSSKSKILRSNKKPLHVDIKIGKLRSKKAPYDYYSNIKKIEQNKRIAVEIKKMFNNIKNLKAVILDSSFHRTRFELISIGLLNKNITTVEFDKTRYKKFAEDDIDVVHSDIVDFLTSHSYKYDIIIADTTSGPLKALTICDAINKNPLRNKKTMLFLNFSRRSGNTNKRFQKRKCKTTSEYKEAYEHCFSKNGNHKYHELYNEMYSADENGKSKRGGHMCVQIIKLTKK